MTVIDLCVCAPDYKTPAEDAGIKILGKDKWLTIIQNAQVKRHKTKSVAKKRQKNQDAFDQRKAFQVS